MFTPLAAYHGRTPSTALRDAISAFSASMNRSSGIDPKGMGVKVELGE